MKFPSMVNLLKLCFFFLSFLFYSKTDKLHELDPFFCSIFNFIFIPGHVHVVVYFFRRHLFFFCSSNRLISMRHCSRSYYTNGYAISVFSLLLISFFFCEIFCVYADFIFITERSLSSVHSALFKLPYFGLPPVPRPRFIRSIRSIFSLDSFSATF